MIAVWLTTRSFAYWASLGLMLIYFLAFMVQYAFVFDVFFYDATRFSRVIQAGCVAIFLVIALVRMRIEFLYGIAAVATLIGYHIVFTVQSGIAPNFNALLGYISFLAFVVVAVSDVPLRDQCRLLFIISLGYVIFYVGANDLLVSMTRSLKETPGGLIDSGDDRGARVFLAALSASFVALYSLEDRRMHIVLRVACIAVAMASIWLSSSRAFTAVFAVIFVIRLFGWTNRYMMAGLAGVFGLVCIVNLYGVFDSSWNPYGLVSRDKSGMGRYVEYRQAIPIILTYPTLGVGIEPTSAAMADFLRVPRRWGNIFWGDLGVIGPLGQFGIVGLALFLFASFASFASATLRSSDPGLTALRLNCALSALYGITAPSILWPPHAFFTAMLFGAWLRRRWAIGATRKTSGRRLNNFGSDRSDENVLWRRA